MKKLLDINHQSDIIDAMKETKAIPAYNPNETYYTYSVLLSDGDSEWWATLKAKDEDELGVIIDVMGYDVSDIKKEN